MKIAYVMSRAQGEVDDLLSGLADELLNEGHKVAGAVQINTERQKDHPCDMDLKLMPDGPILKISQDLGKNAVGCRLDPSSLEDAAVFLEDHISDDIEVLVLNKFGKQEAEGSGFRDAIAKAVLADVPVIMGVNETNKPAFLAFSDHEAVEVPADIPAVKSWLLSA
ncbi:MAG: DUF2478 domain-containing protein [Halocynthiibacter sp.]